MGDGTDELIPLQGLWGKSSSLLWSADSPGRQSSSNGLCPTTGNLPSSGLPTRKKEEAPVGDITGPALSPTHSFTTYVSYLSYKELKERLIWAQCKDVIHYGRMSQWQALEAVGHIATAPDYLNTADLKKANCTIWQFFPYVCLMSLCMCMFSYIWIHVGDAHEHLCACL